MVNFENDVTKYNLKEVCIKRKNLSTGNVISTMGVLFTTLVSGNINLNIAHNDDGIPSFDFKEAIFEGIGNNYKEVKNFKFWSPVLSQYYERRKTSFIKRDFYNRLELNLVTINFVEKKPCLDKVDLSLFKLLFYINLKQDL